MAYNLSHHYLSRHLRQRLSLPFCPSYPRPHGHCLSMPPRNLPQASASDARATTNPQIPRIRADPRTRKRASARRRQLGRATPAGSNISPTYRQGGSTARGSRATASSASSASNESHVASPRRNSETPPGLRDNRARPSESTNPRLRDASSNGPTTGFQRQKINALTMSAKVTGILGPLCFLAFAVAVIRIQGTSTDPTAYGSHNCCK